MTVKEIQIKTISELPSHQKNLIKEKVGDNVFNQFAVVDALVEIQVANSIPHINNVELLAGTFSARILNSVNGGKKVEDIFKY
jgi:hypothetical protein